MHTKKRRIKRKIKWGRVIILLIILSAFITAIGWAATKTYKYFAEVRAAQALATAQKIANKKSDKNCKYINILLLGLDDGDIDQQGGPKRSDAMILASISKEDGSFKLLSIPRDTRVSIPGYKGYDKITHAYFYGGPELSVQTVEELLDIPIQHYVVVDWQAFIKIVDILGGVDLYVENKMDYEDPYANLDIHLNTGYQHLDGIKAGQYVRYRSDELGDIGRVKRQQRFLKALGEQALSPVGIIKTPYLIHEIGKYINTDLTTLEIIAQAKAAKAIKTGTIQTEMLPGNFATINNSSYWLPDKEQVSKITDNMLNNEEAK